jgi:CheY-like chemotaxis protein
MKTVLVIEDEQPLLEAIVNILRKNGAETVSARSVEQAQDYIKEMKKPDAVWLDHYLLGSESGLDMVVSLKNNDDFKDIPIYLVSNTASESKIRSYIELGIDKYYAKMNTKLSDIVEGILSKTKED